MDNIKLNQEQQEMLDKIKESYKFTGGYINDHDNSLRTCVGFLLQANGFWAVLLNQLFYSINELKIDSEGKLHLTIRATGSIMEFHKIDAYNERPENKYRKIIYMEHL